MQTLEEKRTVIGVDFSLAVLGSGSSGNCSLIRHKDTALLIDAGFSAKETCARLAAKCAPCNRA